MCIWHILLIYLDIKNNASLSSHSRINMIIHLWQQEKITVSGIYPLTLSTIATQLMLLVKHPRQHTRTGSRNKAFAQIKGHMSSLLWWCIPCARKQQLCCAKEFKAIRYILCIFYVFNILCIFYILYSVNVSNILACFQHESTMAWKRTTGITRITLPGQIYL